MFDVVKIAGAMLAYLLWAKAMRYTHIIVEVVFGITYVLLSWFFINHYGMIGPIYAFGVNQILYFATLVVVFRKILF
jgi:PST family polysaccharide transporter